MATGGQIGLAAAAGVLLLDSCGAPRTTPSSPASHEHVTSPRGVPKTVLDQFTSFAIDPSAASALELIRSGRATPKGSGADGLTLFLFRGVALDADPSGGSDTPTVTIPVGYRVQVDNPVDYVDHDGGQWYAFQILNSNDVGTVYWLNMTALQEDQMGTRDRRLYTVVVGNRGPPATIPSTYNGVSFVAASGDTAIGKAEILALSP